MDHYLFHIKKLGQVYLLLAISFFVHLLDAIMQGTHCNLNGLPLMQPSAIGSMY